MTRILARVMAILFFAACTSATLGYLAAVAYIQLSDGHYEREPAMTGICVAAIAAFISVPFYSWMFFRKPGKSPQTVSRNEAL